MKKKEYVLTNFQRAKHAGKATESDHFTQFMDLEMEFLKEKPWRQEFYNFNDSESLKIFNTLTSETTKFTNCFEGEGSFLRKVENWRKTLKLFCDKSFKKIRLKKQKQDLSVVL